jgi:hypothetical protein
MSISRLALFEATMSEINSEVAAAPSEPLVYRPLSFLAIAGLCLSASYTTLVVITSAIALFKGAPFFLAEWVILIAIAGGITSLLALWQIRRAEGVLAGEALARWGLWLSIVPGLGYSAYTFFTGLALTQQANRFVMEAVDDDSGFFPRLQAGTPTEIKRAFLLTLPYDKRARLDPSKEGDLAPFDVPDAKTGADGRLSRFRDTAMIAYLTFAKKQVEIEPLGVQEWKYDPGSREVSGGYMVSRAYRLTSPEVIVEVVVPALSTEGESSEGQRKWLVDFQKVFVNPRTFQMTTLGLNIWDLRKAARKHLEEITDDKLAKANFKSNLPPKWQDKITALLSKPKDHKALFMLPPDDDARSGQLPWPTPWERLPDGRLRFTVFCRLQVEAPDRDTDGFRARALMYVETKEACDPQKTGTATGWIIAGGNITQVAALKWQEPRQ